MTKTKNDFRKIWKRASWFAKTDFIKVKTQKRFIHFGLKFLQNNYFQKGHLTQSLNNLLTTLLQKQPQACNFIKKETLAQMFSSEFCEISENTFFTEHLWTTASLNTPLIIFLSLSNLKNVHILVQLYFHIIIRRSGLEVLFKSTCNFTKTRPQHRYKSFNVVQIFQRCRNHYSMLYKSFKSSYRSP